MNCSYEDRIFLMQMYLRKTLRSSRVAWRARFTPAWTGGEARRCACFALYFARYFVFAAFASAATAVFESCCEFMNFVTTSEIAPAAASGCAMPCASEGT